MRKARGEGLSGYHIDPGVGPMGARPGAQPRGESVLSRGRPEAPGALRGALRGQPGLGVFDQRRDRRTDAHQPAVLRRRQPRSPRPRRHRPVPRRRQLRLRQRRGASGGRRRVAGRQNGPGHAHRRTRPAPDRAVRARIRITAHSIPPAACVVVPDKGLDRLFVFTLDTAKGTLVPASPPSVKTRSGAGPRHIGFNPRLPYAYVINELDSTVATYRYSESGALEPIQILPSIPATFTGDNTGGRDRRGAVGALRVRLEQGPRQHRDLPRRRIHGAPVACRVGADQGRHAALHRSRSDGRAALRREPARRHHRRIRCRRGRPARSTRRAASSWRARPVCVVWR